MQTNGLYSEAFSVGHLPFSWMQILLWVVVSIVTIIIFGRTKKMIKNYAELHHLEPTQTKNLSILSFTTLFLMWVLISFYILDLSYILFKIGRLEVGISGVIAVVCIMLLARIADALISARIIEEMENRHAHEILRGQYGVKDQRTKITKLIQYSLITLVSILGIKLLDVQDTIYTFDFDDHQMVLTVTKILSALLVILAARVIVWMLINLFLYGWYQRNFIDLGKQVAYNQLISYVLYTFAMIIAMQYLGLNFTLLWAGAAALLVGIGIALQQVISDFFSGLIILFERSVEVGDFLDFGTFSGTVKKIGIRASIVETLDRKDIIIPNSKLANENVTNWTRTKEVTRFEVNISAAYGSDTQLVKEVLLGSVKDIKGVLTQPVPFVRFANFGESSLDFILLFYSLDMMNIEDVKSDIRFAIDKAFRENNISIPFPQTDVWIKGK